MECSRVRHREVSVSTQHCSGKTIRKTFVLGVTISAVIWASLAVGTLMITSELVMAEQARLTLGE